MRPGGRTASPTSPPYASASRRHGSVGTPSARSPARPRSAASPGRSCCTDVPAPWAARDRLSPRGGCRTAPVTLRGLKRDGLISRKVYAVVPPARGVLAHPPGSHAVRNVVRPHPVAPSHPDKTEAARLVRPSRAGGRAVRLELLLGLDPARSSSIRRGLVVVVVVE